MRWPRRAWALLSQHRRSGQELTLLAACLLVLGYLAFMLDIFVAEVEGGGISNELLVELDEALLLGAALALGLLVFGWRRYRDQQREMARRIAAEREARELAYQDPLTGLANRRQFEEALAAAVASPPRAGGAHAVFLIDLNGFKQINDVHGHRAGDEVLVAVGRRVQRAVREGDLVARLGGDEFIVLARHLLGPEAATSIALRIVQGLDEPIPSGGVQHHVGAGIGIALLPGDAASGEEAIRKADVALYRAKAERRSAFRFFEEEMDRLVQERQRLEGELRAAIRDDAIRVRYRPAVELRSGRVVGFEATPSWHRPDGSEIPPGRFLPVAEETGLVHQLATRVLEQACEAARDWPGEVTLSVDILPGQIRDRDLARSILATLAGRGLDPRRLEIEITESMIVQDTAAARTALAPLREAGVRIALDNFGTGYSSLYHMRELKLDKVKIDRRFLENADDDEAAKVVRALAGLGHGLGLTVSAEGFDGAAGDCALLQSGIEQAQPSGELLSAEGTLECFAPGRAAGR